MLEPPLIGSHAGLGAFTELGLHIGGAAWRAYDPIIGEPVFYNGFSERIKAKVLNNPELRKTISSLAQTCITTERQQYPEAERDNGQRSDHWSRRRRHVERQLKQTADAWLDHMICKTDSKRFIRGAYFVASQLLTSAYHQGIHVSTEDSARIRSAAQQAASKGTSIIFLPCHRSHVDYISLQIICYRLGIALPTVVAGDNLNFPVVGPFLQHAGAMYIRRSFNGDALYTSLVQSYIDTLLQNGHNIECFVEGSRSRTGKLLQPKFGILSVLLDSCLSDRVEDAIICPVSTQYDKVIEVDSYISELLGQPKPKESLSSFLSSSSILSLKLGRIDVKFHEPWSLRDFIRGQTVRASLDGQLTNTYTLAQKRHMLSVLAYRILADINAVSVVMPTALLGTVLLTLRGRGIGKAHLVRRVEWLRSRIKYQGGRVAHFPDQSTQTVVDRALQVLGSSLVGVRDGLLEPTYYAVDRFQLSFYRNMTIHLFVSEALVCAAVYTKLKDTDGRHRQQISYSELSNYVYFLSRLFRAEFIFPIASLADNINKTLRGLQEEQVLELIPADPLRNPDTDPPASIVIHETESLRGRENFDFYCHLIWPFVEAGWLGAVSLLMLVSCGTPSLSEVQQWFDLKSVQTSAQLLGKTLYAQGLLSHYEAVNRESLQKTYQRVEEEGIIDMSKVLVDNKPVTRVRLCQDWRPRASETIQDSRLWHFCEKISSARMEKRGDGADAEIAARETTLNLVDMAGEQLRRDAQTIVPLLPQDEPPAITKQVRQRRGFDQAKL